MAKYQNEILFEWGSRVCFGLQMKLQKLSLGMLLMNDNYRFLIN